MLEPCWLASGQQPTILDDSEQYLRAREAEAMLPRPPVN